MSIHRSARRGTLARRAIGGVLASATLIALAGCAGGADAQTGGSAEEATIPDSFLVDGKPTELSYWSFTTGSQAVVDLFNETHDDIHVTFTEIPAGTNGGYTKLFNAYKAKSGPDVFNVEYPFLPDFVGQGYLADLTGYVDEETASQFLPQSMQLTTLGDHVYGIPYDLGVQLLYYRADLFEEYGLDVPRTWDEFRSTAEKLKAEHPGTYLSPATADDAVAMAALSWQAGAHWFTANDDSWNVNFDDEQTRQVATFWEDMIADDLVSPTTGNSEAVNAAISKGEIITKISASWDAAHMPANFPDLDGKWQIAPLPSWDGEPASGMNGGSAWAVGKDSPSIAAASVFATWMSTNEEAVRARVNTGKSSPYLAVGPMNDVAQQYAKFDYYSGQNYYEVFDEQGHGLKDWTWGPTMTEAFNSMKDALGNVYTDRDSVMDGLLAGQEATVTALDSRGVKVTEE